MDIKSAESQINKLLDYVKEIESKRPTMYKKSKDRLKGLSDSCMEVVHIIANILQEEELDFDEYEFSGSSKSSIRSMIESMEKEVANMKSFIGVDNDVGEKLDPSACKDIVRRYRNVVEYTAGIETGCYVVDDCADLIWKWFSTRFVHYSRSFKYNVKNLKSWTIAIVLLYGKHHEMGDIISFKDEFDSWMSDVLSGTNNYAVPYEVNLVANNIDESCLTLSGIVIWDVLVDKGYNRLCSDSSKVYPSEDEIYELYASKFPSILNQYRRYQFDESILDECRLKGEWHEI